MAIPAVRNFRVLIHDLTMIGFSPEEESYKVGFTIRAPNAEVECRYLFVSSWAEALNLDSLNLNVPDYYWKQIEMSQSWTTKRAVRVNEFGGVAALTSITDEEVSPKNHTFFLYMYPHSAGEMLRFNVNFSRGFAPISTKGWVLAVGTTSGVEFETAGIL